MPVNSRRSRKAIEIPSKRELTVAVAARAASMVDVLSGFLRAAGVPPQEIQKVFQEAAARAVSPAANAGVSGSDVWTQLSDAIAMWFRDGRYLDENGHGLPLPESGQAPSIDHLLETCVEPDLRPRARALLAEHAEIDAHGRWHYPLSDGALRLRDHAVVERLQLAVKRMYESFLFNSSFVAEAEQKNFDRVAAVNSFPVAMLPALRRRMHRQLALVVREIDMWLTHQQSTFDRGAVCDAGVGVYLFSGTPRSRKSAAKAPRGRNSTETSPSPSRATPSSRTLQSGRAR